MSTPGASPPPSEPMDRQPPRSDRPDSAVVILMITDENDCSIRESGQYFYAARDDIVLPHGSSACVANPNDRCCYFCNAAVPAGCSPDPTCSTPEPRDQDQ